MAQLNTPMDTIELYKKEALAGDAGAAFTVGECYEYGSPVEKNISEALHWYKIASNLGDSRAKTSIERLSWEGYVSSDADENAPAPAESGAADTRSLAPEQGKQKQPDETDPRKKHRDAVSAKRLARIGDAENQYLFGVYLLEGYGVKVNEKKGVKWLKKAARQGMEEAQYRLGLCLEAGLGIRQNEKAAFKWFKKAALGGLTEAEAKFGIYLAEGRGVKKNEKLAETWLSRAAGKENLEAAEALRKLNTAKYAASIQ